MKLTNKEMKNNFKPILNITKLDPYVIDDMSVRDIAIRLLEVSSLYNSISKLNYEVFGTYENRLNDRAKELGIDDIGVLNGKKLDNNVSEVKEWSRNLMYILEEDLNKYFQQKGTTTEVSGCYICKEMYGDKHTERIEKVKRKVSSGLSELGFLDFEKDYSDSALEKFKKNDEIARNGINELIFIRDNMKDISCKYPGFVSDAFNYDKQILINDIDDYIKMLDSIYQSEVIQKLILKL